MTERPKAASKLDEIEMHPDAWERFERAVKRVAKHEPIQRPAKPKKGRAVRANGRPKKADRR